jgi:hypothetical protein|tara:strand:- start:2057 stop:2254 length:198 start_codon:yes stop_codon:yes gene_type:complete
LADSLNPYTDAILTVIDEYRHALKNTNKNRTPGLMKEKKNRQGSSIKNWHKRNNIHPSSFEGLFE